MKYRRLIIALHRHQRVTDIVERSRRGLSELALDWGLKDVRQLEYG